MAQTQDLAKAKELFYRGELIEVYAILRRFFDRLPFRQEKEHAEYVGMFTRTLLELGRQSELKFYTKTLESIYSKQPTAEIAYQLASIYCVGPEPRFTLAREILESVLKTTQLTCDMSARCKMLLALTYDMEFDDNASCRQIIDSITEVHDPDLKNLVIIWKGKILRDEKHYKEAETLLKPFVVSSGNNLNWYVAFSATNILATTYLRSEQYEKADQLIAQLADSFKGRNYTCVSNGIRVLEKEVVCRKKLGLIKLSPRGESFLVAFGNKEIKLQSKSISERLFISFAKHKFLSKEQIIQLTYDRSFKLKEDDKVVYYLVHSLRKLMGKIGIPSELIEQSNEGYKFNAKISFDKGE